MDGIRPGEHSVWRKGSIGISLGIVGLESFGRAFADLFASHLLVDLIAICDREPDRVDAFARRSDDAYFADSAFSDETALFYMSNGATMRICEYREVGHPEGEIFRVYGTEGSFENDTWSDRANLR